MQVDPEAIRTIAGVVDSAADDFRRQHALISAGLTPDPGRAAGWSAADAVRSAVSEWAAHVRRLSSSATIFGNDLRTAAARYAATDQESAAVVAATAPEARLVGP